MLDGPAELSNQAAWGQGLQTSPPLLTGSLDLVIPGEEGLTRTGLLAGAPLWRGAELRAFGSKGRRASSSPSTMGFLT